jgi:hypothetical protein
LLSFLQRVALFYVFFGARCGSLSWFPHYRLRLEGSEKKADKLALQIDSVDLSLTVVCLDSLVRASPRAARPVGVERTSGGNGVLEAASGSSFRPPLEKHRA